MKLNNRTAVITGAGSGIGRSCAICFAREGADVVVADIDLDAANETVAIINTLGTGSAVACRVDVADETSVKQLVSFVSEHFSALHALINNAAIQVNKTVEDTTFDEWQKQMTVNVGGVFMCSKYFLPLLRVTKGSIVNMSSVNAYFVEPSCAGYCATKAAIIGLTKAMAIDHGGQGVRVNCICPGYIDAGLAAGYFEMQSNPTKAREEAGQLHALKRIGSPDEIGKVAVFLASDDASFITGSAIGVNGGFGSGLPPL